MHVHSKNKNTFVMKRPSPVSIFNDDVLDSLLSHRWELRKLKMFVMPFGKVDNWGLPNE